MLHLITQIFQKVDRKTLFFGIIETSVILILFFIVVFRKPQTPETIDNSKRFIDSIEVLQKDIVGLKNKIIAINKSYDSLSKVKQKVEIRYETQIKYLNNDNLHQLDSLLRAEW